MSERPKCLICGEPIPEGEEMFKIHGFSGDCPSPPLPTSSTPRTNDLFGITDEYMPGVEEVELKFCRQLESELRKTKEDASP